MTGGICIVAHFAYGSMAGGHSGHIGGVERQMSLMGRWLAARGHRVSLLTWDEGQPEDSYIDGVRIIKMCRREEGVRGVRFFHPRWTSLCCAMRTADASLYYQNCAEYVTGQVALWCRYRKRAFVYSVASDPDCDPRLPQMKTHRDRILYRAGLRLADRIIVQSRKQQRLIEEGFGVKSVLIPMPCPDPGGDAFAPVRHGGSIPRRVVWVGRICPSKRLDLLLDVAADMPDVTFEVAGGADADESYCAPLLAGAKRRGNVILHGRVSRERMEWIYGGVSMLCCTSDFEGFPNTFLEAWSHGLPVVSTVDPDDIIVSRGLGAVAHDRESLVDGIRTLLDSPARWNQAAREARRYFLENHSLDRVMGTFEAMFLALSRRRDGMRSCL